VIYSVRDLSGVIGTAQVDAKKPLGRGATAIVYPAVLNGSPFAAKIYLSNRKLDTAKIEAMLGNPPANVRIQFAGAQHSQLAWPSAILTTPSGRDLGYLMPLMDLSKSFSLDHYYDQTLLRKLKSPSEGALSFKLEIARNLCLLVADLHDHNHCFIDMKPQNIRVLLGSHVVTLLDCDGFSIAGSDGKRYPAELLSSDYTSPEAYKKGTPPSQLGEDQDRYALAVILFQLINGGTHPFQGIINGSGITAATNDEKAAQGLYPHGMKPDSRIAPRPQSIHFLLDDGIRALFDAAFIGPVNQRPTARDWAHLLDTLLRSKALTRCDKEPFDLGHMRFADKPCPACYLAGLQSTAAPKTHIILPPLPPTPTPSYQKTPPIPPKPKPQPTNFGLIAAIIFVIVPVIFLFLSNRINQQNVVDIPTPVISLDDPKSSYIDLVKEIQRRLRSKQIEYLLTTGKYHKNTPEYVKNISPEVTGLIQNLENSQTWFIEKYDDNSYYFHIRLKNNTQSIISNILLLVYSNCSLRGTPSQGNNYVDLSLGAGLTQGAERVFMLKLPLNSNYAFNEINCVDVANVVIAKSNDNQGGSPDPTSSQMSDVQTLSGLLSKLYTTSSAAEIDFVAELASQNPNFALWTEATTLILSKLKNSTYQSRPADAMVFYPNLGIKPFNGMRFKFGNESCKKLDADAGICLVEENGLLCDAEMFGHKNLTLCPTAMIR